MRPLPALLGLALLAACGRETVAHDQDERSANRIATVLFREAGIIADRVAVERSRTPAFDVTVAGGDLQAALAILDRLGLPAEQRLDTCALLDDGALIPSPARDHARRTCGLAGDIGNQLRRMRGVVDASAAVSVPEERPLEDPTEPREQPTVAVFVAYLPDGGGKPPLEEADIARFAASAVPGMKAENVFVRLIEAPRAYAPSAEVAGQCARTSVLGLAICAEHRSRLAGVMLGATCGAGLLAGLTILATLRAMRYRRDLTKLTARVPAG